MVLRRLPEAQNEQTKIPDDPLFMAHQENLSKKGLPVFKFSKIKHHLVFWAKKIWRFALEAKEMAPTGAAVLKIKKLFYAREKPANANLSEETDSAKVAGLKERDFLDAIKQEPKNLAHYDNLGMFYLGQDNFSDAKDVYLYLANHDSGKADYWARLGFISYRLKNFNQAIEFYRKSVALDSSQPNRYYNLAQCYKAASDAERAREALNQALKMDPQNFKFLELKGRLEKQIKNAS